MEREYWLQFEGSKTGWYKTTQRKYQTIERACGFSAPEGQDATASFSGTSKKSGLTWHGTTFDPYQRGGNNGN